MPEGPTIVILKEELKQFQRKKIISVTGNTKIDTDRLLHKTVKFKSWGKHFLICFNHFTVRVHFLMFGSYLINDKKKDRFIRLGLTFSNGELNLYACAVKIIEENLDEVYDWSTDVMNDTWDEKKAIKKLKAAPAMMVCDALLEQDIFSGVGNIIKNEVLFRLKIQPESLLGKLSAKQLKSLVQEARVYSFQFLEWKKKFELKKHFLAHTKKICPRCNIPLIKKITGTKKRRSFFCTNCQQLHG
jgi:endonuclease-8